MNHLQPEDPSQEQTPKINPQQSFLIGLLAVMIIIILVVSILILTDRQPEIASVPTSQPDEPSSIATPTSSPSNTLIPTQRATFTPKPSQTATISPTSTITSTPTLLPTQSLAFPNLFSANYELLPWSPELASQLIDELEYYPDTLSSFARGVDGRGYYNAFEYALLAQREALLRFPSAAEADQWQWQLAYNYARTGDPGAGEIYANLITQELNQGNTSLDQLYTWGLKQSPEILIEYFPLNSAENNTSNYLVKVTAADNGSSYFWLIERTNGYIAISLTSNFDFVNPNSIDNFVVDLLGPNSNVVGIFPTKVYDSIHYDLPELFSLLQEPPNELAFDLFSPPAIGPDFTNTWLPVETINSPGDLQFSDQIFPACPVSVDHFYEWNGQSFTFIEATYTINPDPDLLAFCEVVINHSINVWGVEPTIELMEVLLPDWPPEMTITGRDYPEDALDEWRYRLGVYHALAGHWDQSVEYMQLIIDQPSSPDSRWIASAAGFLSIYQTQRDIYRACLGAQFCNPQLGLISLISTLSSADYPLLNNVLIQSGVDVRSRGFFDFDNDGDSEQWLVIRHQNAAPLEFWIISSDDTLLQSTFVHNVETFAPRISYLEPLTEPPFVRIDPDITFHYIEFGPENKPIIVIAEPEVEFSSDRTSSELDRLEGELLTGGNPEIVLDELIIVGNSPFFTCSYILCPRYLYLLGLANELAGNESAAVDVYVDLWRRYPSHPYTIMARHKLGATFIPTPTPTTPNTATPIPESPETPAPTATATLEGYPPPGYPPPEASPTSTQPGYPNP